ncbi:MAG: SgcJ/EcaC family oxidoreductase [Chitinophagaceae bacterium]|nr:MAG: SgcJ/EcaC family oxidoreductase [Chitinophagaceae bacterium]
MKKAWILLLLVSAQISLTAQQGAGLDSIKAAVAAQEADWNSNNMPAFARHFTEDATLINFLGLRWTGKQEIIKQFAAINECCIKPTSVKFEVESSAIINPETIITWIRETLTAKQDYPVPGKLVKKGEVDHKWVSAVWIRSGNSWKIRSMQVTLIVPMGPPPPAPKP